MKYKEKTMVYKSLEIKDLIKDKNDEMSNVSLLKGNNSDANLHIWRKKPPKDCVN